MSALAEVGITLDAGRVALEHVIGTAGLSARDAAALRTLGIDLDEVRSRAEAAFGPGALDRPFASSFTAPVSLAAWPVRAGRPARPPSFMPRAKRAQAVWARALGGLGNAA